MTKRQEDTSKKQFMCRNLQETFQSNTHDFFVDQYCVRFVKKGAKYNDFTLMYDDKGFMVFLKEWIKKTNFYKRTLKPNDQ